MIKNWTICHSNHDTNKYRSNRIFTNMTIAKRELPIKIGEFILNLWIVQPLPSLQKKGDLSYFEL